MKEGTECLGVNTGVCNYVCLMSALQKAAADRKISVNGEEGTAICRYDACELCAERRK